MDKNCFKSGMKKLNKMIKDNYLIIENFVPLSSKTKVFMKEIVNEIFEKIKRYPDKFKSDLYIYLCDLLKNNYEANSILESKKIYNRNYFLENIYFLETIASNYLTIEKTPYNFYRMQIRDDSNDMIYQYKNVDDEIFIELFDKKFIINKSNKYIFTQKFNEYFYVEKRILSKNKKNNLFKFILPSIALPIISIVVTIVIKFV